MPCLLDLLKRWLAWETPKVWHKNTRPPGFFVALYGQAGTMVVWQEDPIFLKTLAKYYSSTVLSTVLNNSLRCEKEAAKHAFERTLVQPHPTTHQQSGTIFTVYVVVR